jgi:membrane protein YqaA with SNARE-associated domain
MLAVLVVSPLWNWLHRLGGVGLILLGLADNSLVPLPGSVDALTIILAAHNRQWWWYYAIMATIGSLVGGYLTFRLGHKGGEEALQKKLPANKAKRVYRIFNRYGFWAVAVPALLPPPVPIVPFLIAAGALKYSRHKFISALALGRGVRYFIVAYLGHIYGKQIFAFFGKYYRPILYALISLAVAGGITVLILYLRKRRRDREKKRSSSAEKKVA